MAFWEKKKKRDSFSPFDSFFMNFDSSIFGDMEKQMEEMMKSFNDPEFIKKMQQSRGKPIVSGFSMRMSPDGKVDFKPFGNVVPTGEKPVVKEEREPLVDVIDKAKEVTVIAELPGVDKREIKLKVLDKGKTLSIHVHNKFGKKVELPARVKTKLAKANYKNGVLEVNLIKERAGKPDGDTIPIE